MQLVDILSPISATTATIVILLSAIYYFIKNRNILPGPRGFPYLGLYPTLKDETCHKQLEEIGKKYGDLFSFTYLGNLIINLGSVKAIREVHVNKSDCFAERFTDFNLLTYILEDGVAMTNGEAWKVLRKYFIQAFKEYGLTIMRDNMAGPVYDSLSATIEDIKAQKGASFNVIEVLTQRCTGTMQTVLYGEHLSKEEIYQMNEAYEVALDTMTGVQLLIIGPLGKLIFHISPKHRKGLTHHKRLMDMLYKHLHKMKSSMDLNNPTCVVEDFYAERNKRRQKNDPTHKYFTDKALVASVAQFVGDGIISIAFFVGLFLNALVEHPEEQDKIYKELEEVVGPNRMPTIEDKSKLTYTNAFMNEVVRTSNFFPLFPSLACTRETTIRGYRIPKGSITLLNIWSSHHDPQTYENPYKFDPSRFIAAPGRSRAELPVQFGLGKRACTGEPYAAMQGFLFLTNLVKTFTISESENPQTKSEMFLMTGNMELRFRLRKEN